MLALVSTFVIAGGDAYGGIGVNALNIILQHDQFNEAANAYGGQGGSFFQCVMAVEELQNESGKD